MADECPICRELLPQNLKYTTKCKHSFHKSCLNTWLNNNNNCPLCRQKIGLPNYANLFRTIAKIVTITFIVYLLISLMLTLETKSLNDMCKNKNRIDKYIINKSINFTLIMKNEKFLILEHYSQLCVIKNLPMYTDLSEGSIIVAYTIFSYSPIEFRCNWLSDNTFTFDINKAYKIKNECYSELVK